MIKKILLAAFLIGSSYIVTSMAADDVAKLNSKTKLLEIPHAKISEVEYSLVFKMDDSVMPSVFSLQTATEDKTYDPGGDSGHQSYYTKSDKTLVVPKVDLDGKGDFHIINLKGDLSAKVGDKLTLSRFMDDEPSFLFSTAMQKVTFKASGTYDKVKVGQHFLVTGNPAVTIFSDRPYRIAHPYKDGLKGFTKMFADSDFVNNPPNSTFKGVNAKKEMITSVVEFGKPIISGKNIVIPVIGFIGEEPVLPYGVYTDISMVIDSWWNPADWCQPCTRAIEDAANAAVKLAQDGFAATKEAKDAAINVLPIPDAYKEWVRRSLTAYSCSSAFGFVSNYQECIDTAKNVYYDANKVAHQL